MAQNDVLTLIRFARKYPEHNESLLAVVEHELNNGSGPYESHTDASAVAPIQFPIELFHYARKKRQHRGALHQDGTIIVDGVTYYDPSPAAMSITRYNVNGRTWWSYEDPASGAIRPFKYLQELGSI